MQALLPRRGAPAAWQALLLVAAASARGKLCDHAAEFMSRGKHCYRAAEFMV